MQILSYSLLSLPGSGPGPGLVCFFLLQKKTSTSYKTPLIKGGWGILTTTRSHDFLNSPILICVNLDVNLRITFCVFLRKREDQEWPQIGMIYAD